MACIYMCVYVLLPTCPTLTASSQFILQILILCECRRDEQEVNKSLFSTVQSTGVALPYIPIPYFYVQYSPKYRTPSSSFQDISTWNLFNCVHDFKMTQIFPDA